MAGTEQRQVAAQEVTAENVRVDIYDPIRCQLLIPWWDALTPKEKLRESQHLTPIETVEQANTTCVELHYLIVDLLDGAQTVSEIVDAIAVGRSDTPPEEGDTALNDHVADVDITAYDDRSDTLRVRSFVGTDEANVDVSGGETLSEAALKAGDYFLSHSLFSSDIEKDETIHVIIRYDLTMAAK